ncbi:hypothetical protein [Variovorax boronicumulans]|nr:hypothetical protein [Variovorax boronicumulans]
MDIEIAQKWLDQVAATCNTLDPELILDRTRRRRGAPEAGGA